MELGSYLPFLMKADMIPVFSSGANKACVFFSSEALETIKSLKIPTFRLNRHNPKYVYSEVSLILFTGSCYQETVLRMAVIVTSNLFSKVTSPFTKMGRMLNERIVYIKAVGIINNSGLLNFKKCVYSSLQISDANNSNRIKVYK